MSANDVYLLAQMIDRAKSETDGLFDAAQHEAYFVAKHWLSDMQPSADDIVSGIVDGTRDGGVDAMYVYANGYCLRDDSPIGGLGKRPTIELVILQSKNVRGFGEGPIDKLLVSLPELLAFDRDEVALSKSYNERLIEVTRRFLTIYQNADLAELRIYVAFASLKAESDIPHDNVALHGERLVAALQGCFSAAIVEVAFMGAGNVAEFARRTPVARKDLSLTEIPIATETHGGYLGVVSLAEYGSFITDSSGRLDASLFEANVRDYEGRTVVNESIAKTLSRDDADVDFWWLNNGVTIVANRVQQAGKLLKLESPQVVNGLQTSHEIFQSAREGREVNLKRSVMVKVIEATNDEIRDRIIRATNSQTALGSSALRATDRVQRQIEEHLKESGLFYERRRNHYANASVPLNKLISIDQMGKAVVSALGQAPHVARGSMARVFDTDLYDVVFSDAHPIQTFSAALSLARQCETFLRSDARSSYVEDFLHHMTMCTAIAATRKERPSAKDLAEVTGVVDARLMWSLHELVTEQFAIEANRGGRRTLFESLAKSDRVTTKLAAAMSAFLRTTRRVNND